MQHFENFASIAAGNRTVHLRVIETTDLHLHLLPYDYYNDCPAEGLGLQRAAELIAEARAEVPNAVLFDNGDFLQGTPMGDFVAQERGLRDGDIHPMMAAMNALDFDAITLGNHEFNYGLDFLHRALGGLACPVVSANLTTAPGRIVAGQSLVRPYVLLDRMLADGLGQLHPIRIGVIGFVPPQVANWDRHNLQGRVWAHDILAAARTYVPEMREAGADLIIALAHSGIGSARHSDGMENAAIPLARLPGIDALLTGHSHLVFPSPVFDNLPDVDAQAGTIAGKPAVMGGCWGSHVGLIDLLLMRDGSEWQVLGTRSEARALRPARGEDRAEPAAPPMPAVIQSLHRETLAAIRKPVGRSTVPLHSYFAHLGVNEALCVVAEAQRAHVSAQLRDPGLARLAMLSSVAPFQAGGRAGPLGYTDVPAGPLALRHVADLYAYPNTVAALLVTGAQVLDWLERSAAAFNVIRPGSTETLLRNPEVPGYNFEVIDELDIEFDLTQPARFDPRGVQVSDARRVRHARYLGRPLDADQQFVLCTNSYRAGGTGSFADPAQIIPLDFTVTRDAVRRHIVKAGTITPCPRGGFGFTPVAGTCTLFETGPGARAHLSSIAGFAPEIRGETPSGFLRLRLDMSHGRALLT